MGITLDDLQKIASEYHDVRFVLEYKDRVYTPEDVISWRGHYAEPSLSYSSGGDGVLGCMLWHILEAGLCSTHRGYKGGYYMFERSQTLNIDNYGEYSNRQIVSYEYSKDSDLLVLSVEDTE